MTNLMVSRTVSPSNKPGSLSPIDQSVLHAVSCIGRLFNVSAHQEAQGPWPPLFPSAKAQTDKSARPHIAGHCQTG